MTRSRRGSESQIRSGRVRLSAEIWVFGQIFGSRSLPLVSRGKLYSTLVLNLLLATSECDRTGC
jgi:hypothetical protein